MEKTEIMITDDLISSAMFPQDKERAFRYILNSAIESAKEIEPEFTVYKELEPVVRGLALYFSNDSRFEEEGFGSLKKGLYLCGNVGAGKTLLMRSFAKVVSNSGYRSIAIIGVTSITETYVLDGIEGIKKYYEYSPYVDPTIPRNHTSPPYCFDDLGSEPAEATFMGNRLNVMQRIISSRYDRNIPFIQTHFTSNLNPDSIEKMYGIRVRSRLRQMVNFLVVPGDDRRK